MTNNSPDRPEPPARADGAADERDGSGGGAFRIVGVRASASGLQAFTKLLNHLPLDTGMGFVLVQHVDPQHESARYDSMPRSAVAAGCVDFVLSPENIAKEPARIAKYPYVAGRKQEVSKESPMRARF